ncbi:PTS fructose transporter subunit IIA [Brachybacterium vulturis]|uniref:PTS fructose transporter subunit IIA n=1 Tax=Brachybacterium vulturis TaxID=2017484 RepID=A0A291GJR5_9MICO|nr:PTS sugar transporter subunit IIA [Brachybacterium vulturis]ATG50224.1 PTS fructose transporter subunit IIA [Brachybacterium vulturis]
MSTDPRPSAEDPRPPLGLTVVLAHLDVADDEDVLRSLAGRLLDAGAVTVDFPEALRKRERTYPTGLPTPIPTAIPHADPEHVVVPGLALATLARPVPFGEMGASGSTVDVRLVVMPLLTDAREHLTALQRLMGLLRDEAAVAELLEMTDDEALRERAAALLAATLPGSAGGGPVGSDPTGSGTDGEAIDGEAIDGEATDRGAIDCGGPDNSTGAEA